MQLRSLLLAFLIAFGSLLGGCGGDGENQASPAPQLVTGIAATGMPMSGTVLLRDSATPPRETTIALNADGSFSFDVTDLSPPFLLKAVGSSQNGSTVLYSFAASAGIANINPLSNLGVINANSGIDPANADAQQLRLISWMLPNSLAEVRAMLQPTLARFSADTVNFITDPYVANHRGLDLFLDVVDLSIVGGDVSVLNRTTGDIVSGTIITFSQHPLDMFTTAPSAGAVYVFPGSSPVPSGGSLTFKALVVGTSTNAVNWSVVEPGGGSFDSAGRYTAPASSGVYHVKATNAADPSQSSTATVNVFPTFEQAKAWKLAATMALRSFFGNFNAVTIAGDRLYTAEGQDGMRIFDVSDPSAPRQIGAMPASAIAYVTNGAINEIYGVVASGNIAAVSGQEGCTGLCIANRPLLQLYDVSDPVNPRYLSWIPTSGSTNIIFEGHYLYHLVDNGPTSSTLLQVVDIVDPSKPVVVGSVPVRSGGRIIKSGDMIFASSSTGKPVVIGVADPTNPVVLFMPDESSNLYNYPPNLASSGNALFVGGAQGSAYGISLLDVSDPAAPVGGNQLGSVAGYLPFVRDHFLYVADRTTLNIYDIADPANPIFVTSASTSAPIKMFAFTSTAGVLVTSEVATDQGGRLVVSQGEQLNIFAPGH